MRQLVCGIIDELITLATAQDCSFPGNFRNIVIEQMTLTDRPNTMYQDFQSRRPMEVEMYLGSPIKFAQELGISIPRIETVYSMVHYINLCNQQKQPLRPSPSANHLKTPSGPTPRQMSNGSSRGPPRRGPPSNGMMNGMPNGAPNGMPNGMHRPSMNGPRATHTESDDPNLEEFSHLVLYDDPENGGSPVSSSELALRERELALKQRELKLREKEMQLRRGKTPSRARRYDDFDEDDGDDDDYISTDMRPMPQVDPDSIDMLSVTSRRNRKGPAPEKRQLRRDPEAYANRPPSSFSKYFSGNRRKQASERIVEQMPTLHDTLWENPMMTYASNRYGNVDRSELQESRANSMTSNYMPPSMSRRPSSHSPGAPVTPRGMAPPSRPQLTQQDLYNGAPGPSPMPRPSPNMSRVASANGQNGSAYNLPGTAVEQPQQMNGMPAQAGVSSNFPNKPYPNVRSLTGSASASAGSGDSGSGNLDFNENSATSSQISLGAHRHVNNIGPHAISPAATSATTRI